MASPRIDELPRRRWLAVVAAGAFAGVAVGLLMPRGPVTTAQALTLLPLAGILGACSGWALRSRWAILAAPAAYMAGFELAWAPSIGLTVDTPHLSSTWGLLAILAGRGFHFLVAVAPMMVGATLGAAAWRRRSARRAPSTLPRKIWLALRRTGVAVAVAGLALLVIALARPASTPAVTGPDGVPAPGGIAELTPLEHGGATQWLSIRGRDRNAPVLLYLPGGPGQSDLGLSRALLEDLTGDFIVATLDGRGIGKAYSGFDDKITVDNAVDDVVVATDYLRRRFDEDRIFLFGESGGSFTGVLAVQRHPDRYLGWIGSGQMVDVRETDRRINEDLHALFARTGDADAARTLRSFGQPPYESPLAYAWVMGYYDRLSGDYDPPPAYTRRAEQSGVGFMGLGASEYTLVDKVNAVRGLMDGFSVAYPTWQSIDFRRSVRELQVPVYLFTGDHELAARRDVADEWFRALRAPHKHRYSYPDGGHATAFEHADDLHRVLVDVALPESAQGPLEAAQ